MPRLGLGRIGIGQWIGRAAAVAPILDSAGSIDQQPLVAEVPVVTAPVFSGATTITLQWWNGNPDAGGVAIVGATSLAWVPTASEFGATLYLRYTATNAAGSTLSTIVAPSVVGRVYFENWSGYAVGNTWTQLDTLYSRTSTGVNPSVISDALAPAGKAVAMEAAASATRLIWRDADATFGLAEAADTTRTQALFLFKHQGDSAGRYMVGFVNTTLVGTASMSRVAVRGGVARLQIDTEDVNLAEGTTLATLTVGTRYWVRMEISETTVGAKLWEYGTAEPASFTTRTNSVSLDPPAPGFGTRHADVPPAMQFDLLWWSGGYNADAPYWAGFSPPVGASSDPQTFSAAGTVTSVSFANSAMVIALEDV